MLQSGCGGEIIHGQYDLLLPFENYFFVKGCMVQCKYGLFKLMFALLHRIYIYICIYIYNDK